MHMSPVELSHEVLQMLAEDSAAVLPAKQPLHPSQFEGKCIMDIGEVPGLASSCHSDLLLKNRIRHGHRSWRPNILQCIIW